MIRSLSLAALIASVWALHSPLPAQNKDKDKDKLVISKEAQTLIDLTNKERAKAKLGALKHNPLLAKCAQAHSEHMAKLMKAGHIIDGKTTPEDRVLAIGYDHETCGENVAQFPKLPPHTLPQLMAGWMASPDHRREILRGQYEEIGIGIAKDRNGFTYYTQVFGKELPKQPPANGK